MSDPRVESYIQKKEEWSNGLKKLRKLIMSTELEETIKWGAPVYTINNKNIVGLSSFNEHFGLWFFQGCFLKDKAKILVNAQEGKTKAMRQVRFKSIKEIDSKIISAYIKEAIGNHKKGMVLKKEKKPVTYTLAVELEGELSSDSGLKKVFYNLSPYKQKEFSNYISDAKREATKIKRLQKIIPLIKEGKSIY